MVAFLPVAKVVFTRHLRRHLNAPDVEAAGETVSAVLNTVFTANPQARSYVLEDQGGLRKHITVFINGEPIRDRATLTDPVPAEAEIYIMQALSGG